MDLSRADATACPREGAAGTGVGDGGIEVSAGVATEDPADLGARDAVEGSAKHPAPSPASVAPPEASEVVGEAASKSSSSSSESTSSTSSSSLVVSS